MPGCRDARRPVPFPGGESPRAGGKLDFLVSVGSAGATPPVEPSGHWLHKTLRSNIFLKFVLCVTDRR